MLNQFFHPHNFFNLTFLFISLIFFDISGWGLLNALKIKTPLFFRPVIWFFGLGQVVFLVFISHFFTTYNPLLFIIFILILTLPWLKSYFKTHQPQKIFFLFIQLKWLFLIFIPLAPYIFVKTSLPPYVWDEMAYHYISPYKLLNESSWTFDGLYQNLPRLLDTAFISFFSVTKTYATARLLHFLILFFTLLSLYLFTKKYLNRLTAFLALLLFTYLNIPFLTESTLGYIDVGTASFTFLATLSLISLFINYRPSLISFFFFFSSLALGSKYSAIAPFLVSFLLIITFLFFKSRKHQLRLNSRLLIFTVLVSLILGGYWYLKNWYLTGNPIYPFLFSGTNQSFFAWTIPLDLSHLPLIAQKIFFNNPYLNWVSLISILMSLFFTKARTKKILLILLCFLCADFILQSYFTGFEPRYFYHWLFFAMFILAISFASIIKKLFRVLPIYLTYPGFLIAIVIISFFGLKKMINVYRNYAPGGPYFPEVYFAAAKMPLKQWIESILPQTAQAIYWCDQQPDGTTIAVKDPDLLWFTYEAQFHVYLTHCHTASTGVNYLSLDSCADPQSENNLDPSDEYYQVRKENRNTICTSQPLVKNLYYHAP